MAACSGIVNGVNFLLIFLETVLGSAHVITNRFGLGSGAGLGSPQFWFLGLNF